MTDSINSNENVRLLIKLEEQLKNTNEDNKQIIELTNEIFNKIDFQSKEIFDLKSKLDTLKEVTGLKFKEMEKQVEEVLHNVKETTNLKFKDSNKTLEKQDKAIEGNKNRFDEFKKFYYNDFGNFKKDEFKPIAENVKKAEGAISFIKFAYPALAIIMSIASILIAVWIK